MLSTLLNQLVKNVKTLPGWAPLLLILYVASYFIDIKFIDDSGAEKLFKDTCVIILAFFSYQLGDAIDKVFYKKFEGDRLSDNKCLVREKLDIKDGIYRVMKAFAISQHKYTGSWTQVLNESAKLIRSLTVVFITLGVSAILMNKIIFGIVSMVFGVFCLYPAFFLKLKHISRLYSLTEQTVISKEYKSEHLSSGVRLFFWDGELVGSAMSISEHNTTLRSAPKSGARELWRWGQVRGYWGRP